MTKPDGTEDPRDHIGFHEEIPVGKTAQGKATVAVLGLDRTEHAPRLRRLDQLKKCRDVILRYRHNSSRAGLELVADARAFIEGAVRPEAPFSAMAMAFVARNPLPS